MNTRLGVLLSVALAAGCARVTVDAPKEPIKLDITMRLDVYQHVAQDIDAIENLVTGSPETPKTKGDQSFRIGFVTDAYADEGLSPEVQQAALNRKERRAQLVALQQKGIIGENKSGLVELRPSEQTDASAGQLVSAENADRMVIYQGIAAKNGTSVEQVQEMYAKRLQNDALPGTSIEILDAGRYVWKIK